MANAGFNLSREGPTEFAATLQRQDELFRGVLTGPAFESLSGEHFGPMLFPAFIGVMLAIFLAVVVWQSRGETEVNSGEGGQWRPLLFVLLAALFYLLAAEPFGFVVTAWLMVAGLLIGFGVRVPLAVSLGVGLSVVVYQVFAIGLRVPLPRGLLGW